MKRYLTELIWRIDIDTLTREFFLIRTTNNYVFSPEPSGGSIAGLNRAIILKKLGLIFILCAVPNYPSGKVVGKERR